MTADFPALAKRIRYEILTMTTQAGSGHPTSSLSAVELMTSLWFGGSFRYNFTNPNYIFNDRMIFSKGHASPLLYALYVACGVVNHKEVLALRTLDSSFEGHPTPRLPWVDVSTGSLGQGLSVGLGMALAIKQHMKTQSEKPKREPIVWTLMGDSEFSEGQIWEAIQLASYYHVNNLVGILDVNRLGQRGETMLGWDLSTYSKRIESFGWNVYEIENGNDIQKTTNTFELLSKSIQKADKPSMIVAKTQKGAGVSFLENADNWHGKALSENELEKALSELRPIQTNITQKVSLPEKVKTAIKVGRHKIVLKSMYEKKPSEMVATREAYGKALELISDDTRVITLDAETSNSTYAEAMKKVAPERFYEMFIAEQNMISVALGFSKLIFQPFASTFAAFLARAYDQIRMAQYSDATMNIVGSHAGVSIGEDGSSQMALEDIAMMRALLESVVLYPSDGNATIRLVNEMRNVEGLAYLRLSRMKTPIIYSKKELFPIGGSKVLKESQKDKAVVVSAGVTLHEALKAYELLQEKGVSIGIIDAYSVKPLDELTIREHAKRTGKIIVVEDHYPYGGLGDAVRKALTGMKVEMIHLAVSIIPHSATPSELLDMAGIDAQHIVKAVK